MLHTHRLNHQRPAPLGPRKCFFGRFLLRLSKIKCSQVMSVVKLTPQNFIFVMKTFLEWQGKISSEQLRKIEKIKLLSHSRAKKNILTIFPVLGKLIHMSIFSPEWVFDRLVKVSAWVDTKSLHLFDFFLFFFSIHVISKVSEEEGFILWINRWLPTRIGFPDIWQPLSLWLSLNSLITPFDKWNANGSLMMTFGTQGWLE